MKRKLEIENINTFKEFTDANRILQKYKYGITIIKKIVPQKISIYYLREHNKNTLEWSPVFHFLEDA